MAYTTPVSVNLKSSKPSAWSGYFTYSYEQSISDNYTKIKIQVYAKKEDGWKSGTNSTTWDVSIKVNNGTPKTLGSEGGFALPYSSYYCYGSDTGNDTATFTVYHNNDGTKTCNIKITAYPASGLSWDGESLTYDDNINFPTIPRASSISAANDVNFGDNCDISWEPLSSSFYYKLKFSMGTWEYTTDAIHPNKTTSYQYTGYAISLDAARQIPNTVSGTMSVSLYSYNTEDCSKQIGNTSTSSFIVTLSDDIKPEIDSCTATKNNSMNSVVDGWDIALAGYTKVDIAASASGAYGSSIISFNISGSYSATVTTTNGKMDYTGDVIKSSGNKLFKITCTDSRGRVSDVYESNIIAFTPYRKPRIRKLSMSQNSSGKMVATATWEYDEIKKDDGTVRNSVSARLHYKPSAANEWTIHSGTPRNGVAFTLTELTPDEELSYNFKVVITDALGNVVEKDAFSSTTRVLMDFQKGGRGLGIGKICEINNEDNDTSSLEVAMDSYFWRNVILQDTSVLVIGKRNFGDDEPEDAFNDLDVIPKGLIYFKKV